MTGEDDALAVCDGSNDNMPLFYLGDNIMGYQAVRRRFT